MLMLKIGFGLRVNHFIHQVAKAAGISDLSAKVHGSRNGTRVIKLAVSMLHGGSVPLDMGDAFGHKGQRRNKKASHIITSSVRHCLTSCPRILYTTGRRNATAGRVG